jgi:hypothetical protein
MGSGGAPGQAAPGRAAHPAAPGGPKQPHWLLAMGARPLRAVIAPRHDERLGGPTRANARANAAARATPSMQLFRSQYSGRQLPRLSALGDAGQP